MTRDDVLAKRTAEWTAEERAALADVVDALRPSAHHLGDALDWLEDIAARVGARPTTVLDDPTLRTALAARGSAPDRWKRWKEALRRLRYPRLVAREQEFRDAVRTLDLGRAVTIAAPPAFDGAGITVTIRAGTASELEAVLARLEQARSAGALAALFSLLD